MFAQREDNVHNIIDWFWLPFNKIQKSVIQHSSSSNYNSEPVLVPWGISCCARGIRFSLNWHSTEACRWDDIVPQKNVTRQCYCWDRLLGSTFTEHCVQWSLFIYEFSWIFICITIYLVSYLFVNYFNYVLIKVITVEASLHLINNRDTISHSKLFRWTSAFDILLWRLDPLPP